MDLYFLRAHVPLVKHFQQVGNEIKAEPYPMVSRFTSIRKSVANLQEFYDALCHHATQGHCLLKGTLSRELINESRAKATDPTTPSEWMCLDVDGIPGATPDSVMASVGMPNVSYIVQYSASMGVIPNKGLSCHIIVLLNQPTSPSLSKHWLVAQNVSIYPAQISLNRLNESLHYPLDITTCQNDKLIYVAVPVCTPSSLDTFNGPRIVLVRKDLERWTFPPDFTPIPATVLDAIKNKLRADKGLPKSPKLRIDKSSQLTYSPNPQAAQVTGIKIGEEFTHLNINGGDSWGYYHLTNRPDIIYNFKGEPNYKTSELLPEYWDKLQKTKLQEKTKNVAPNTIVLAVRDRESSIYYTGYYNNTNGELTEFYPVPSKEHAYDFLTNNGVPIPDSISDWNCSYNPHSFVNADIAKATINWFKPSAYMRQLPVQPSVFPQSIYSLLQCVLGNDKDLIDHFCHWLAVAFRLRRSTGTAWILQGVPGTGKGMLVNQVLLPLFGRTNVAVKRMTELHDKFNQHLENTLLCFVDEIAIGENTAHDKILADLKQFITEPQITIRRMRQAAYEVENYTNWIFSTNNKHPVHIEVNDRRYNVGEYMRVPLRQRVGDTFAFVEQLKKDLDTFVNYLLNLTLDLNKASVVYENEARKLIIEASMSTIDVLSKAINEGDIEKLYEFVEDPKGIGDPIRQVLATKYRDLMKEIVLSGRNYLTRDDLAVICDSLLGNTAPKGAAKFTQFLGHHDIKIKVVRANDKLVRGVSVDWRYDETWLTQIRAELMKDIVVPIKKVK